MTAPTAPADDRELVARALGGHQPSYSALMTRHREAVYRVARHHVGEESEALDLCQEAFISAFASLNRFDPARPFRAWLLRIALNKCRDWGRRRTVRRLLRMAKPLDDAYDVADEGQDPESSAISARELHRISAAVAALPANLKDPLILCRLEGMSMAEAAQVLGVSEKAVETRVYRARQKLSAILEG
ncbi:MAG: RNA polymerase subunit sigma-24 [Novosphingobium sp. 28-62-57]|uniref:RNA polymerase sigma factor n=1 Tax=unclassified Novosphingobium TaxID=2644732 RepID=UPI000BD8DE25|nr:MULTISPECIES: RNA polymerase sigma factor [unclassified Novosphingobium]OYW48618.1 MAG: RNA polymerase subunit sigma-24 [Novosphingobium sp. 12-62-10]OYZ10171.1 MAG: RNA polymerase subunit sigma-24 [Novosphingobium sp. 28-62-57]OZA33592.1 MAG: RNA polymerase subunit sigma-24 [Novosphingobium sp. 17-62-9]HQS70363.1 RNA polymerase sigma factor [Novosphingobium sp.]